MGRRFFLTLVLTVLGGQLAEAQTLNITCSSVGYGPGGKRVEHRHSLSIDQTRKMVVHQDHEEINPRRKSFTTAYVIDPKGEYIWSHQVTGESVAFDPSARTLETLSIGGVSRFTCK